MTIDEPVVQPEPEEEPTQEPTEAPEVDEEEQAELDRRAAVVQEYEESNARMQAAQEGTEPAPVEEEQEESEPSEE